MYPKEIRNQIALIKAEKIETLHIDTLCSKCGCLLYHHSLDGTYTHTVKPDRESSRSFDNCSCHVPIRDEARFLEVEFEKSKARRIKVLKDSFKYATTQG